MDFNEQEYRRKRVERGVDSEQDIQGITRTAEVQQNRSVKPSGPTSIDSLLILPTTPGSPTPSKDDTLVFALEPNYQLPKATIRSETMTSKKTHNPAAVEALAAKVDEAKQAALLKHSKKQIKDLQLSLFDIAPWSDSMRALPNDYARSALFTVRNRRIPRVALQNHAIFHVSKDVTITYTGVELRAEDDELVWQQVLEYAKRTPLGNPVTFTFYELCQDLDWSINGRYYKKAEECLSRLQASAVQFSSKRVGQLESLSFISYFRVLNRGKKNSHCQVMINAEMVVLFAGDYYSTFIWEKYRKLSSTARRMFDYFASHQEPYPMKLETFRLMCGSESSREKKWREQVNTACGELRESGLVEQAWVHDGLVHCKR